MASRLELHELLCAIPDVEKVYFQPPESVKLTYPCIIYGVNNIDKVHADDYTYSQHRSYSVTVIDYDPDSPIVDELLQYKYCSFDRSYISENLNHFVFTFYY